MKILSWIMAKYYINEGLLKKGFVIYALMIFLTIYAHEFGHVAVCSAYGYEWQLNIALYSLEAPSMYCYGFPENPLLLYASGGLAGLAVSALPVVLFRKKKYLIIGCAPSIFINTSSGILETLVNEFYMNFIDPLAFVATIIAVAIFAWLLLRYSAIERRQKQVKISIFSSSNNTN